MKYPLLGVIALCFSSHGFSDEVPEVSPAESRTTINQSEPTSAAALPAPRKSSFYAGLRAGAYQTDVSGIDVGSPAGVVLGFGKPDFGFEMDIAVSDMQVAGETVSYSTAGFYLSYRTASPIYMKFRVGMVEQAISVPVGSGYAVFESDFGFSTSLGLGKRFTDSVLLDLDYTVVDQDLSSITLGLNKHF